MLIGRSAMTLEWPTGDVGRVGFTIHRPRSAQNQVPYEWQSEAMDYIAHFRREILAFEAAVRRKGYII
jgi:hypothetical protein